MATILLSIGPSVDLLPGITYALPARVCQVNTVGSVETSVDGSAWNALASGTTTGAKFIRSAAGATVICKTSNLIKP